MERGVPEWVVRELEYHRDLLYRILAIVSKEQNELAEDTTLLRQIEQEIKPQLAFIKIAIGGVMPVGPATLAIGQKAVATVLGFDQNGAPMPIDFVANPVKWTDDNEAAVQDDPTQTVADPLTALAAGVANLGASCAGFSDTETVTVPAAAPVLSSIKISIDPIVAVKK